MSVTYLQIAADLRAKIESGSLRPGDHLPSCRALATNWGVSHVTAQRALVSLHGEGLVEPRRGIGTIVRPQISAASVQTGGTRFQRAMATGKVTREGECSEILSSALTGAPHDVAEVLEIQPESPIVRRHRRFVEEATGTVTAVSTSWIPADLTGLVPELLLTGPIPGGTIGAIQRATGRSPGAGVDTMFARLATAPEAAELGLETPSAVLVTTALLRDREGRWIEYGVDVVQPDLRRYVGYDLSR